MNTSTITQLQAILKVKAVKANLLPSEPQQLLAWIEKYGPVIGEEAKEITFCAPASDWIATGMRLRPDGSLFHYGKTRISGISCCGPSELVTAIVQYLEKEVTKTGTFRSTYDAVPILKELQASQRKAEAEQEKYLAKGRADSAERLRSYEAEVAKTAAKKAALKEEMKIWITDFGSNRLQRCMAEGIECQKIYDDERLAAERPGWEWDTCGEDHKAIDPPDKAFALLDEARKTAPNATLGYMTLQLSADDDDETEPDLWCGYVAKASFSEHTIVYGRQFGQE